MHGRVRKVFGPARIDVPAGGAGTFREVRLDPMNGGKDVEFCTYAVRVLATGSTTQTRIKLRLYHGPDGVASTTHTSEVIASTTPSSLPAVASGDSDHSKMLGEWLHPALLVGTNDGAAQWVVAEVWEVRHAFPFGQGALSHRKLTGPVRLTPGAAANDPGLGLEATERGADARTVQYALVALNASVGTAQVAVTIQHSIDREQWIDQKAYALADVGSTGRTLILFDSDPSKGLLSYVRPVVRAESSGAKWIDFELYETVKPY